MAQMFGPDESTRLGYRVVGGRLQAAAGLTVTIYTDSAGTTPAVINVHNGTATVGAVISGSTLTVSADSKIPLFWFPDGVDTLYAKVGNGIPGPVYADVDSRLDGLPTVETRFGPALGGLTFWWQAIGKRHVSPVNVVCIGSSTTYGSGATTALTRWVNRFGAILHDRLPVTGVAGGWHTLATEGTFGGWSSTGTITSDSRGLGLVSRAMAAAATLTRTDTCTGWDIHYAAGPGAGAFDVTIDGGAPTTVTPDITGTANRHDGVYSTGLLSAASHTLLITATNAVTINGAYVRSGDESAGIRVFCSGKGGLTAATWAAGDASLYQRLAALAPALVTIQIGPNDYSASVSPAAFSANVQTIIDRIEAYVSPTPSIMLLGTFRRLDTGFTPAYTWQEYLDALAAVAANNPAHVSYVDTSSPYPTSKQLVQAHTLIDTSDYLHPTDAGHALMADLVAAKLLAAPPDPESVTQPTFSPALVGGLLADFDPQSLTSTLTNGAAIASWAPSAGLEQAPLAQATSAQRPILVHSVLNNLAVARFTISQSSNLDTGAWTKTRLTSAAGKTVFIVFKRTTAAGALYSGRAGIFATAAHTSGEVIGIGAGATGEIVYTTAVAAGWYVWCSRYDTAAGQSRIYRDSVTADRTGTTGTGGTAGLPGLRLGSVEAGGSGYIDADIARVIVYDRSLAHAEIGALMTWLGTVYNLPIV